MKYLLILMLLTPALQGCNKNVGAATAPASTTTNSSPVNAGFTRYTIEKGKQFADSTEYLLSIVSVKKMHFLVIFDSSAIYQTDTAENQHDINKLYGFADNNVYDHHAFSARFGWNWYKGQLLLYAYVYNNSVMSFTRLGAIPLGSPADCAIVVRGPEYLFTLNGVTTSVPRASTTATGAGYKLYPYFGGNEVAPHKINIDIKEIAE